MLLFKKYCYFIRAKIRWLSWQNREAYSIKMNHLAGAFIQGDLQMGNLTSTKLSDVRKMWKSSLFIKKDSYFFKYCNWVGCACRMRYCSHYCGTAAPRSSAVKSSVWSRDHQPLIVGRARRLERVIALWASVRTFNLNSMNIWGWIYWNERKKKHLCGFKSSQNQF